MAADNGSGPDSDPNGDAMTVQLIAAPTHAASFTFNTATGRLHLHARCSNYNGARLVPVPGLRRLAVRQHRDGLADDHAAERLRPWQPTMRCGRRSTRRLPSTSWPMTPMSICRRCGLRRFRSTRESPRTERRRGTSTERLPIAAMTTSTSIRIWASSAPTRLCTRSAIVGADGSEGDGDDLCDTGLVTVVVNGPPSASTMLLQRGEDTDARQCPRARRVLAKTPTRTAIR